MRLLSAFAGAVLLSCVHAEARPVERQDGPPRILLDQSPRAVEYQLGRLTNDQLVLVERKPDEVKYRLVYVALLTRKGLPRQFRDEAIGVLTKMDQATTTRVLLDALGKVPVDDGLTAETLLGLLLAQPLDTLRPQRDVFARATDAPGGPLALRGAYAAEMIIDGKPDLAWQSAVAHDGHLLELLRSVQHLPSGAGADDLRAKLATPITALTDSADTVTRAEALAALVWVRRDAATFGRLSREILEGTDEAPRAAAIHGLQLIPDSAWPKDGLEPLARTIVRIVGDIAPAHRTDPPAAEATQLGERLAAALPDDARRAVRRDLRALSVQIVRIETIPEQVSFNLKWFVVEAGKPAQIVLVNPDAMSHNLVISKPGSLQEVATAGGAMPVPTDTNAKAFVPNSPLVLFATRLLQGGESERLGFVAPREPGEYVYACTFPGHWLRMYGVMLVVANREAWEANPTPPIDPLTKKPFESPRH
jgi:azurin